MVEPTCTSKGSKEYQCSVCSNSYIEDIDCLPHSYDQKVPTKDYLMSDATCTTKAKYNYSCKCGAKGTEFFEDGEILDHLYKVEVGEVAGTHVKICERDPSHTYVEDCNGGEATCTNEAICKECLAKYGSLKEHSYTSNIVKESTCLEAGVKEFICLDCNYSYQEELPLLNHDYKLISEQKATCF